MILCDRYLSSNLDSHIFDALSQTSDNMYIYIADLERDFSRWSKPSVDYFNLPGEFIENTAKEWVQHISILQTSIFFWRISVVFLRGKSNRHNCEYRALNKYGKYVWVRCQGNCGAECGWKPWPFCWHDDESWCECQV